MNKAQLEEMKPGELTQYAKNLGLNTKGKNPRDLVPLILKVVEGEAADSTDSTDEGDSTGNETAPVTEPTAEEIVAAEAGLLDEEDPDAAPPDFAEMTEEEVLMHQITAAEAAKAHPAVLTALYNAYERLTAVTEAAPPQGAHENPTIHTNNMPATGRPPKAGSHWPSVQEAISTLSPFTKRGMSVTVIPKHPHMLKFTHGSKEIAISVKQPLRTILQHASLLMRPTGKPTEDLSYEELVDLRHKQIKK